MDHRVHVRLHPLTRGALITEAQAFRFVVIVGAGAAAVIALTLLTRPAFGVVLGAFLIGLGAGRAWGVRVGRRDPGG